MATKLLKISLFLSVLFLAFFQSVDAGFGVCKRKVLFTKIKFTCPEPGQPSDYLFCCGDDDDLGGQYCCKGIEIENLGSIIGTIAGVLGFLLLLLIICCCICPCCILYKRRTAGNVYRSTTVPNPVGPSNVNVTVMAPAGANTHGPPPVGFVAGPNTGYPPQPGYPPQGYPMQPPHAGYPPYPTQGPGAAPYPMHPTPQQVPPQPGYYSDQPPPYPGAQEVYQKQAPYNPAY